MKILSLDGGGVFGFVQARILDEAKCSEKFDAFVGTSIGSAIASAYALGRGSMVNKAFFDEWMPKIFHRSFFRRFNPFVSKYPDDTLIEALKSVFKGDSFGAAQKPLFVTAANIGSTRLKVFNSLDTDDGALPAWQVIRSATAAETYFKSFNGYGDGGVFVNNPSMAGVASAVVELGAGAESIEILSIGTGDRAQQSGRTPITKLGWGLWLIRALLHGASNSMNDYYVRALTKGKFVKRYTRIQFPAESGWKLDDVKAMKQAEKVWEPDIVKAIRVVEDF
jgi:patatin-like phospholipase/acyl hydrolase